MKPRPTKEDVEIQYYNNFEQWYRKQLLLGIMKEIREDLVQHYNVWEVEEINEPLPHEINDCFKTIINNWIIETRGHEYEKELDNIIEKLVADYKIRL